MVAGAVIHADGRVLIAQRPPGKPLAGGWEFPGGKLEPGEARAAGLARELSEELGIAIRAPRPLMRVRHSYTHAEVLIDMWVVTRYAGVPKGVDGQALRWCTPDELVAVPLLAADRPLVNALRLPERLTLRRSSHYHISDAPTRCAGMLCGVRCTTPEDALDAAKDESCDFVVMCSALPDEALLRLCAALSIPVFACGLSLEQAWAHGATGINAVER